MKNALCRIIGILALALLAATQTVRAQEPVLVKIPFEFTAGNMTLPAGEYRVQKPAQNSPALLIQRTDGSASTYVGSNLVSAKEQTMTKLIFHRYGNRYFLVQVWRSGEPQGRELLKSPQEKEQAMARNEAPEQVTIVARLIQPQR